MKAERAKLWAVPAFLALCIVLGGSAQGIWTNMILQVAGVGLLAWASVSRPPDSMTPASRWLAVLAGVAAVVIALQLIPLPASVWAQLPGREPVAAGFATLGYPLPSLPVSLAPYATLAALLTILPAAALLALTIRFRQRESWIAGALLNALFAAVLLGAVQVAGGGPLRSPWYFYNYSSHGAVGFFANVNHMGSLLVIATPFATALFAGLLARKRERSLSQGLFLLGIAALIVTAFGIALNRSLAALIIAVPVLLFSTLLLPMGSNLKRSALLVAIFALMGCLLVLTTSSLSGSITGETFTLLDRRSEIWAVTADLIGRTFPVGTGLGSFEAFYHLGEDPARVQSIFVNHAHNDYLEILLELGLAGALLVAAFFAWWLVQVIRIWRSPVSSLYVRAATIASAALLAHSIVDYPLRTAALSGVFAVCLGLMAQPRQQHNRSDTSEGRQARHLKIG